MQTKFAKRLTVGSLATVAAAAIALVALTGFAQAAGSATLTPQTSAFNLATGQSFSLPIIQNATVVTTGVQTNLNFDKTRLQVQSVAVGPDWAGCQFIIGVSPQTTPQAIAQANASGTLQNIATYCAPGGPTVPAGSRTFVTVNFQAIAQGGGPAAFTLSGAQMIDVNGDAVAVTTGSTTVSFRGGQVGGVVETLTAAGSSSSGFSVTLLVAAILGVAALGAVGLKLGNGYRGRQS